MNGLEGRHNFILEWNCCGRYTAQNVQSSPLENLRVLRHFNNLIFLIAPLPSLLRRLLFHFTYWIFFNLPTTYPPKLPSSPIANTVTECFFGFIGPKWINAGGEEEEDVDNNKTLLLWFVYMTVGRTHPSNQPNQTKHCCRHFAVFFSCRIWVNNVEVNQENSTKLPWVDFFDGLMNGRRVWVVKMFLR